MNEEEKKAIEKIKDAIRVDKERRIVTLYDEKPLFRDQLQIIIDLLNKQQREIEDYKIKYIYLEGDYQSLLDDIKEHRIVYIDTPEFEEKFISKDKIREIIKKYQEKAEDVKQKYKGVYAYRDDYLEALAKIEGYQELLEEN